MKQLLLIIVLIFACCAHANAATFDSAFEHGVAVSASGSASFLSSGGDVAGSVGANSDRCLIAYVSFNSTAPTTVAMTWAAQGMTLVRTKLDVASAYSIHMFVLAAPTTGAQTLAATWDTGSFDVTLGGVSIFNSTTCSQNDAQATGTSTAPSMTITSVNGNIVVMGCVNDNGAAPTIAAGTLAWSESDLNGNHFSGYRASTGASQTVTFTTGNVAWGCLGVDVGSAGGDGSAIKSRRTLSPRAGSRSN